MLKFIKKTKKKTGDVVVGLSHRHATIANALIKNLVGDNNFFYFQTMIVFRKIYCYRLQKKVKFAIENYIFDCRKRSFAFFLRIWNQNRRVMYEPTQCPLESFTHFLRQDASNEPIDKL